MSATSTENVWLTADEAAEHIGVEPKTLTNWRSRRVGPPFYRHGRKPRYLLSEVDEWLKAKRINTEVSTSRKRSRRTKAAKRFDLGDD